MAEKAIVQQPLNLVQVKRQEIRRRQQKERALVEYKKMSKQRKRKSLKNEGPISMSHALFFTVALGVSTIVLPELSSLAIIFSILILGNSFVQKNQAKEEGDNSRKMASPKGLRVIRPEFEKLASKGKKLNSLASPSVKKEAEASGLCFKNEKGETLSQFDWRSFN